MQQGCIFDVSLCPHVMQQWLIPCFEFQHRVLHELHSCSVMLREHNQTATLLSCRSLVMLTLETEMHAALDIAVKDQLLPASLFLRIVPASASLFMHLAA